MRWLAAVLIVLFVRNNFYLKSKVSFQTHLFNTIESKCNAVIFFISPQTNPRCGWKRSLGNRPPVTVLWCWSNACDLLWEDHCENDPQWAHGDLPHRSVATLCGALVVVANGGMFPGPLKSLLPGGDGSTPRSVRVGCSSSLSACKNPVAAGGKHSHAWGLLLIETLNKS